MYGTQILKKKTFDLPKTVLGNVHQHTGFYVFKILYALIFDDTLFDRSVNDVWFGLKISGGQYYFEDGTALTSGVYGSPHFAYPWRSYEPNNPSTDFCIRLQSVGSGAFEWADYNCGTIYNYLCVGKILIPIKNKDVL